MSSFINALRSEWIKLRTLRSTWTVAILLLASMIIPVFLTGLFATSGYTVDNQMLGFGSFIFILIGVTFAGSSVAADYNDHMHAHAFLSQDRRSLWLSARIVVLLLFLLVNVVVSLFGAYFVTVGMPNLTYTGGSIAPFTQLSLATGVFALIAIFVGVATKSKAAAVAIPLVWVMVIETMLSLASQMSKVGLYLWYIAPLERIAQLTGATTVGLGGLNPVLRQGWGADAVQPAWFNIIVLLVWVSAAVGLALVINSRRDTK